MTIEDAMILVVDDKPTNLDVLFNVFEHTSYDVLFASDGDACLHLAAAEHPNLILLDVMMPGLSGFEVCRRLKADARTSAVPIIFMTALADTADKVKGFAAGAVDYITKPIQPEEVLARVKAHLTIANLQTELCSKHRELQAANAELRDKNALLADRERHLRHLVAEKTHKLENMTVALVNALENANLLNDDDTGRHIKRVSAYATLLAETYGCAPDFVKRIALYAPLHDVGKVGLPDALLKKPGKYTPEEFIAMQQHVVIGAKMLDNPEIDGMARNIALYHHERWDGSGYVSRLQGGDIPLEARLVAIADEYDALTTSRVYKPPFAEDEAFRIILEQSGTHFDPDIVALFVRHIADIRALKARSLLTNP